MEYNHALLIFAAVCCLVAVANGDYNSYEYQYADDDNNEVDEQSETGGMIGYDEEGAGFVTVSLYGLLIWQFISLSFGMCLCGAITMCYNRFSEPVKTTQTQW